MVPTAVAATAGPDAIELEPVDALVQLSFHIHGALERRAAELDLSMSITRLLGILRDRRPTMHELAALLGLEKSSVSGLVDRASERGLVERRSSPADGRVVRVRVSVPRLRAECVSPGPGQLR